MWRAAKSMRPGLMRQLVANILAIESFTMNRIYTEFYRNKGYPFTITSSTAFDQKWIYGRNVFESIDNAVEDVFLNYLSRPNIRQPLLTQYCDGKQVQCPQWMRQWESKTLGERATRQSKFCAPFTEAASISTLQKRSPASPPRIPATRSPSAAAAVRS